MAKVGVEPFSSGAHGVTAHAESTPQEINDFRRKLLAVERYIFRGFPFAILHPILPAASLPAYSQNPGPLFKVQRIGASQLSMIILNIS